MGLMPGIYDEANRYREELGKLQAIAKYARHKDGCEALRRYHIPDCPHCGSKDSHWQRGVYFEHMKRCGNPGCKGSAWEPKTVNGECSCGLDEAKKEK